MPGQTNGHPAKRAPKHNHPGGEGLTVTLAMGNPPNGDPAKNGTGAKGSGTSGHGKPGGGHGKPGGGHGKPGGGHDKLAKNSSADADGNGGVAGDGDGDTTGPADGAGGTADPSSLGDASTGAVGDDSTVASTADNGATGGGASVVADNGSAADGDASAVADNATATDPDVVATSLNVSTVTQGTASDSAVSGTADQGQAVDSTTSTGGQVDSSATATSTFGLVLVDPQDSGGSVNYTLDGTAYTIDPGTVQQGSGAGPWLVEFDRGVEGSGAARYLLTSGTYTFTLTDKGWELYNTTEQQVKHRLLVVNPKDSGGSVNYLLDGETRAIDPDSVQDLSAPGPWVVEFDRGIEGGQPARYRLTEGTYTFTLTDKGWELYNTTYDVVLDNSGNDAEFNLLSDGQEVSVPANETRHLTGKFPIVAEFDRGDGGDAAQRTLDQDGARYRVALRDDNKALDLIPVPPK